MVLVVLVVLWFCGAFGSPVSCGSRGCTVIFNVTTLGASEPISSPEPFVPLSRRGFFNFRLFIIMYAYVCDLEMSLICETINGGLKPGEVRRITVESFTLPKNGNSKSLSGTSKRYQKYGGAK